MSDVDLKHRIRARLASGTDPALFDLGYERCSSMHDPGRFRSLAPDIDRDRDPALLLGHMLRLYELAADLSESSDYTGDRIIARGAAILDSLLNSVPPRS